MNLLNRELIQVVIDHALQNDLLRGHFGLEKRKCTGRSGWKASTDTPPEGFWKQDGKPLHSNRFLRESN